ncbi:MAG: T9SS type A sorting domain-containing protein [Balneolia bacterium]|nr:T9SS type A sorting domain-containing protein [Balneolia bacterium]
MRQLLYGHQRVYAFSILTIILMIAGINSNVSAQAPAEPFSFTDGLQVWSEDFAAYAGSFGTVPAHMFVTWDEERTDNPFTGIGDFFTSNPETGYGGFAAYTSEEGSLSFGIRERAPIDLRDARLFFSFTNNTSEPVSTFEISYDVEAWYIGDRRNRIRLKYDTVIDSDDRATFEVDLISTDNPSETMTPDTKVNGALAENRVQVSEVIDITLIDDGTGTNFEPVQPGETAYFRWQFSNLEAGESGDLRSGLAVNNITIAISDDEVPGPVQERFAFNAENQIYTESFNSYRGTVETLPAVMFVTWDETRLFDPFNGVGDFNTSNPDEAYGNFTAYTFDGADHSFGIRERAPADLRDARLFFAFTNDTDQPLSEFEISYDVEAWYIGDRRNRIRLKYDTEIESAERSVFEDDIFSTDNPSSVLTPDTKVPGALAEHRTEVSGTIDITSLRKNPETNEFFEPLQPGETAYFRWQFSNLEEGESGTLRSGLAVNNVRIALQGATSAGPEPDLPYQLKLSQNYPNPFNPVTQISYQLPERAEVTLDVYNIQGQRVATLVNATQASGNYTVSFEANSLSSGVYIYRLRAGDMALTRKMTLIK